jgi:hypothetical protein
LKQNKEKVFQKRKHLMLAKPLIVDFFTIPSKIEALLKMYLLKANALKGSKWLLWGRSAMQSFYAKLCLA